MRKKWTELELDNQFDKNTRNSSACIDPMEEDKETFGIGGVQ